MNNGALDDQDPKRADDDDGDQEQNHIQNGDESDSDDGSQDDNGNRTLFFNQPLPDDFLEDGHPIFSFPRNKIRTAKYTPVSFIPKNLWFQFHNVANIFFLFLIILVVSLLRMSFLTRDFLTLVLDFPHFWRR